MDMLEELEVRIYQLMLLQVVAVKLRLLTVVEFGGVDRRHCDLYISDKAGAWRRSVGPAGSQSS